MSFDQDPNEQANISGADFAIMCDELREAKAEIERLKVEISELDGIVMFDSPMRLAFERGAEIERLTEQLRRSEECLLYERNRLSYANDCIDELQDKLAN